MRLYDHRASLFVAVIVALSQVSACSEDKVECLNLVDAAKRCLEITYPEQIAGGKWVVRHSREFGCSSIKVAKRLDPLRFWDCKCTHREYDNWFITQILRYRYCKARY